MLTKDLILQLQKLIKDPEPHEEVMGPHEIVIDVFKKSTDGKFQYAGFSHIVDIQYSSDGVYPILNGFAE